MSLVSAFILLALSGTSYAAEAATAPPAAPVQAVMPVAPAAPVAPAPEAQTAQFDSSGVFGVTMDDLARLRDPFRRKAVDRKLLVPKTELEAIDYNEMKVLGIVASGTRRVAMLSAGSGRTFFVRVGERIGLNGGRITKITDDIVEITEHSVDEIGDKQENVTLLKVPPEGRGNLSWTPKQNSGVKSENIEKYSRDLGAPAPGSPGGRNP